ncbi:hypothetical protein [Agrobacterium tumefaciens]|uniref:hypothetical protein n=1 Tax=Agrobacterium tumefaciens TaxID=358 RepID=UPI0021D24A20|nr:hypothetical protein [Agrobacterium tumefaciens]UXS22905.1 hypothetical protein FY153_06825 [Agrobacterium tumefaciens]UXS51105.1 hypothetical protein FY148_06630 [Agrobacterium tumefaciens]UXS61351.1 hypothetical protein FY147_06630 [Agrobacterium tumefaciens]
MNRRSFLAALCAAPFIPVAAKAAQSVSEPFVWKGGVLHLENVDISNAYISSLIVRESNIAPEYRVESRRDGMHIVYAEKFGIPPVKIAR